MTAPRALITGAAQGIGRALVEEYVGNGYEVVGIDNDRNRAEALSRDLKTEGAEFRCSLVDLSDLEAVERLSGELEKEVEFDLVIHNAGINHTERFGESSFEAQERVLRVNLYAPLILTACLLKDGRLRENSTLVFISSLSRFVSYPGATVYAATKDGLASYARSLAIALASRKTHVLTVYPGPTRTEHARRHSPDNSREERRMKPEELARRIKRAADKKKRVLIPGLANRIFAALGLGIPSLTERGMKKSILDRL